MNVGDNVIAVGYLHLTKEEAKKNPWPAWLLKGQHQISRIKSNGFGTLVQTDKQPQWMNSMWFRKGD